MGFVSGYGECVGCKKPFSFNPNLVPSVRVNGVREPVCGACVEKVNPGRVANGLEPIMVLPGAYEAAEESSIDWEA
jgi:hypothetical protein